MSRRNIQPAVSLTPRDLQPILTSLRRANAAAARAYPGEPAGRQPVHTMYGGAHLFRADLAPKLGALALALLDEYAPDARTLATALGFPAEDPDSEALLDTVRARVVE